MVTHVERVMFLEVSHALIPRHGAQALQFFWDPLFIITTSTYNKEIRHGIGNTRGEGRVFEVSRTKPLHIAQMRRAVYPRQH